jgi:hypothetical protein
VEIGKTETIEGFNWFLIFVTLALHKF